MSWLQARAQLFLKEQAAKASASFSPFFLRLAGPAVRTSYAPMSYVWNYTAYEKTFRYPAESRTGEGSAQWRDPYGSAATIYRMVGRAFRYISYKQTPLNKQASAGRVTEDRASIQTPGWQGAWWACSCCLAGQAVRLGTLKMLHTTST